MTPEAPTIQVYIPFGKPHLNQQKIIDDPSRFKVIVCGRRFGKTTFAINSLFLGALLKPNGTFWYVAPTYRQAKQIAWRMLVRIYRENDKSLFYKPPNESNLQLQLENGSYIELKGADNEDSLVGVGLDGIVIDEYGIVKPHVWEQILQPTLADTLGWGIFIGTPRGYNHFYSLYESAKTNADWSAFHFTTYDNPHIQRTEIERNKTQMAEDYFAQEYLADFRKFTGLVYKDFDLKVHVVDQSQIPTGYPRWRTIDAGFTNPFVCLFIAQAEDGTYIIYDEYYNQGETTKYNAEMINSQSFGQYFKTTYIDPSARQVAQDMAQFGIYAIGADNTVNQTQGYIAGIPKVAELLKINPRTNKPGLLVSRHCKNTIKEFQNYRWAEKKNKTSGNQREMPHKEHDHSMDALKYWVNSVLVLKEKPIIIKEAKPYVPNNYRTGY